MKKLRLPSAAMYCTARLQMRTPPHQKGKGCHKGPCARRLRKGSGSEKACAVTSNGMLEVCKGERCPKWLYARRLQEDARGRVREGCERAKATTRGRMR